MLGNSKVSTNGNTSEGETEKQLLRLKHLVEKTSIYSKFLYERMKEQQEIKVKEKLRTQNRLTKKLKLESSKIKLTPEKCQSLASSAKVSMVTKLLQ
jgi:predicted DNA-binding transcriptional regulator AlpA